MGQTLFHRKNLQRITLPAIVLLSFLWLCFALFTEQAGQVRISFSMFLSTGIVWFLSKRWNAMFLSSLLSSMLAVLALGGLSYYLLGLFVPAYQRHPGACPELCEVKVEVIVLPSQKEEFVDPQTGARIVRLTRGEADDRFGYYEPSTWRPDDRALAFLTDQVEGSFSQPAVVDVETGEITVYHIPYSLGPYEWSRDGRHLYGVGEFSGPERDETQSYFIALNPESGTAKVLALKYPQEELPSDVRQHPDVADDINEEGYYHNEAFFLHLNPSGTLAAVEMYNVLAVIDVQTFETWVVGRWSNRATFYDDRHVIIEPVGLDDAGGGIKTADVYSGEIRSFPIFEQEIWEMPACNHGGYSYQDGSMSKIYCPGPDPRAPEHGSAFTVFDLHKKSFTVVSQNTQVEGECCDPPITASADEKKIAGRYHWNDIAIYDLERDEMALTFSFSGDYPRFRDQYLSPFSSLVYYETTDYGGQINISHEGRKAAFTAVASSSKERLGEFRRWVEICYDREEHRDDTPDIDGKCEQIRNEYFTDIFIAYPKEK